MDIGKFIRTQRKKLRLSQSTLGSFSGVAHSTISNYENGITAPDLNTFFNISKALKTAYAPLVSIIEGNSDKCDIFEKVYCKLYNITKDVPRSRLRIIMANQNWKCHTITKDSIVIIESNPVNLNDRDLVISTVPDGKEHIFRIRFCGDNTYLMPEDSPPYLCAVRINENTPLLRILAIIRYP